jgi:multicomponent K+:H+ antiporter subunit F
MMNEVFGYAVWFVQVCLVVAMFNATARLFVGPAAQDRVLAFDALYVNAMLLLLVLGIRSRSTAYFDIALLIALFGFLGTLALARFLLRGEVVEP